MTICWKSVTVAAKTPLNPAEQWVPHLTRSVVSEFLDKSGCSLHL